MSAGVIVAFVLIGCGLFRTRATLEPGVGIGVAAAGVVLLGYAATGWFGAGKAARAEPRAFRLGSRFGAGLGIAFALQVFGEYTASTTVRADQVIGWVVFGGLLPLNVLVGAVVAAGTAAAPALAGTGESIPVTIRRQIRAGVLASLWTMLIGTLVWIDCLLGAYLAFWGTRRERRLFDAEGVWADLARSGERDVRAFLMTDYLGAYFFHLTLGPLLGVLCSALGAAIAASILALRSPRDSSHK
jgi:hypothetical protein